MKIAACGSRPWEFFSEPWNLFDFIIWHLFDATEFTFSDRGAYGSNPARDAHDYHLAATATVGDCPAEVDPFVGIHRVLLGLHFYIYAVMGTLAFSKNDPIRFGSLHVAATTLFQVLTLEGWNDDVRDTQVLGSDTTYDDEWKKLAGDARQSYAMPVVAQIYFITFILFGTMIMLNLFTGVIISSMEEAQVETADKGTDSGGPEPNKG